MTKRCLLILNCCWIGLSAAGQTQKVDLYDFVRSFLYDSTGYENVGNWAVGQSKKFPVKWKSDRVEMSEDTSINFFRSGTADITIKGRSVSSDQAAKWNILLKGPRMGYTSFSMVSPPSTNFQSGQAIDSLFGKRLFRAKLIKTCDTNPLLRFYFYEVKLPKKDIAYIKISWLTVNGKTALRIDGYDAWSKSSAKLDCR
jgi:hypothetical protein